MKTTQLLFILLCGLLLCGNQPANAADHISNLRFTGKCGYTKSSPGKGTADDGSLWTVTSDAKEESIFDTTKGIHFGTNTVKVSYLTLSTANITGTIKEVAVNASCASRLKNVKVRVTVGGKPFGGSTQQISKDSATYKFNDDVQCKENESIAVTVQKKDKNATIGGLYVISISVTYASSKKEITMTFTNGAYAFNIGSTESDNFTGQKVRISPSELPVTYSSDNSQIAEIIDAQSGTIRLGSVEGTAKITAEFTGNDEYDKNSTSYLIRLVNTGKPRWLRTELKDIRPTDVFVIIDLKSMCAMANVSLNYESPKAIPITVSDDMTELLGDVGDNIKWNLTLNCNKYNFSPNEQNDSFLYSIESGKDLHIGTSISKDCKEVVDEQYNYKGLAIYHETAGWKHLGVYNKSRWYCYKKILGNVEDTHIVYFRQSLDNDLAPIPISLNRYGYSTTYYSDRALKVPSGVTATAYDENVNAVAIYNEGDIIPKGEAVVLQGNANSTPEFIIDFSDTAEPSVNNALHGSDVNALTEGNGKFYMLSAKNGNVGFYYGEDNGGAFTSSGHKAYLVVPEAKAKIAYIFNRDGETTGISKTFTTDSKPQNNKPLYNLAGQRVDENYKGVVVQDGRKYIVR